MKPRMLIRKGPNHLRRSETPKARRPAVTPPTAQLDRTAVYGPVCPVVWEGRSREAPPYPDLLRRKRTAELANRIPSPSGSSPWPRDREPRCARRSDDTDARREARRCFGRSHRSVLAGQLAHRCIHAFVTVCLAMIADRSTLGRFGAGAYTVQPGGS